MGPSPSHPFRVKNWMNLKSLPSLNFKALLHSSLVLDLVNEWVRIDLWIEGNGDHQPPSRSPTIKTIKKNHENKYKSVKKSLQKWKNVWNWVRIDLWIEGNGDHQKTPSFPSWSPTNWITKPENLKIHQNQYKSLRNPQIWIEMNRKL